MVTETAEQPVETTVTPAEQAKADEAAFNSEFAKDLAAETTTTPPSVETPAPVAATPAEPPAPEPPKEPKYVQITEDQLQQILSGVTEIGTIKAGMTKLSSDAFGRLGGVEQFINKIKEKQGDTPVGQAVLTDEDFAELKEEFPELATLILQGQKRVLGRLTGTGASGLDATALEARRTQEAIEVLDDNEAYADWRTIVGAEGSDVPYRQWLKTQPEAYQHKANHSKNPFFVMSSIDKFHKYEADQAAAEKAKTPKTPPPDTGAARRQQLQSAIAPKGAGTVEGKAEVDEFQEAYKKEAKSLGLA